MKKSRLLFLAIPIIAGLFLLPYISATSPCNYSSPDANGYINMLCKKPANVNSATWEIKHGGLEKYVVNIPKECLKGQTRLRYIGTVNQPLSGKVPYSFGQCLAGNKWITVTQNVRGYGGGFYTISGDKNSGVTHDGDFNTCGIYVGYTPILKDYITPNFTPNVVKGIFCDEKLTWGKS